MYLGPTEFDEFDHGSNWAGTTGVNLLLNLEILLHSTFYSLASTTINQSAPNLVTMYMSIRSQMCLIMGQVIPDQCYLPLK